MSISIPSFDDLLQGIITDYSNLDSNPNTSQGSIVFIKASVLASAMWGIYNYQKYLADQQFPDTASTENLNHWGSIYGITRFTDESDSAYASRIIVAIQTPAKGGTAADYKNWAESQEWAVVNTESVSSSAFSTSTGRITVAQSWPTDTVTSSINFPVTVQFSSTSTLPSGILANTDYYVTRYNSTSIRISASRGGSYLIPTTQGSGMITLTPTANTYPVLATIITPQSPSPSPAGTVVIIYLPDDDSILTASYINGGLTCIANNIKAYIETLRPVTATTTLVYSASTQAVSIEIVVDSLANLALITSDIQYYISSMVPGQTLYKSNLTAIAINDGAKYATVVYPLADTTPAYNRVITCSSPNIHY